MKEEFYQRLQNSFVLVRHAYAENEEVGHNKLDSAFGELRFARKIIDKKSPAHEKKLLLYCIDTLLSLVAEGDRQKIHDFADTVHNMPEIFMGKRNYHSFRNEIKHFRSKYGEEYFSGFNKVFPVFNKKVPKNALFYFTPLADEEFKANHPKAYPWLLATAIMALLLPMLIYCLVIFACGVPNSFWMVFGLAGAFIIGVGLFNIVSAFVQMYLGHTVTIVCLLFGGAIVAASLFLLFHPSGVNFFDERAAVHVFFSFLVLTFCIGYYFFFRDGFSTWLKRKKGLNMTQQHKLKKGFFNYVWYLAIQKEIGWVWLFPLNSIFTVSCAITLVLTVLSFVFHSLAVWNCLLLTLTFIVSAVMYMFYRVQENLEKYNTPIVLYRADSEKGFSRRTPVTSIVYDLGFIAIAAFLLYVDYSIVAELHDVSVKEMFLLLFS